MLPKGIMAPITRFKKWEEWLQRFNRVKNRRFFRYGVPFMVLVFGGSFYLKQFTSIRYHFKPNVYIKPEDVEQIQKLKKREKVTLEEEYEKIKDADIDHWENVRIYRPWEDPANNPQEK